MLELSVRLLFSGFIFLLSGWFRTPELGIAWKLSVFLGLYASIGYLYESKRGRTQALSTLLTICDCAALLFLAAGAHQIEALGFSAVLPALYAQRRYRVNLWVTLSAAAGLLFIASLSTGAPSPPPGSYLLAIGFLALAYFMSLDRSAPQEPIKITPRLPEISVDSEAFLVLRENFRKLKDTYRELEQSAKKEHAIAALHSCKIAAGASFHTKLAEKISELCDADSVCLYTLSQFGDKMVVRATAGTTYPTMEDSSYSIDLSLATRQVTDKIELATRAMLSDTDRARVATVLLTYESRVIGMLNLFHTEWDSLYESKRIAEELAPIVSHLIVEHQRKAHVDKRIQELEILYETAAISTGATGRVELAERITRRLAGVVTADFVGTYLIERGIPRLVSHCGFELPCLDCMSFLGGEGYEGWLSAGSPELAVFQPTDDQRCKVDQLLRKRVGGFLLVPLQFGEMPFGYMVAASRASGALEASDLVALRAISCEFAQAVCRIEIPTGGASGLVTPTAFQILAGGNTSGCLIYFELLKRQQLKEVCEPQAIRDGLRAFSLRLRGRLTAGGAACQKPGGDFVAFLPNTPRDFAANWANEVAATASMIGIGTASGKKTLPLAFRARVAELSRQTDEVFTSPAS